MASPLSLPMLLTWARIAMVPLVVGVFYLPDAWIAPSVKNVTACSLFTLAAITDAFDGYLARRYGQTSQLGAFLDPVADKLMVCAALVVLLGLGRIDALVALVIIGREIAVSALREWMARIGASRSVAVSSQSKPCWTPSVSMDVSRISPAPSASPRWAHSTASIPSSSRPPRV